MKKKLLTILLSAFMVLMSLPATVSAECGTVQDIIATYPGTFPVENGEVQWVNGLGAEVYVDKNPVYDVYNYLVFYDSSTYRTVDKMQAVSPSGNNYVCIVDGVTYTFHMRDGKLKYINVSDPINEHMNGDYPKQTSIEEVYFDYFFFSFANFTYATPKAPIGVGYETDSAYYLLNQGQVKYYYDGGWRDNQTRALATPRLGEVDKAAMVVTLKTDDTCAFADAVTVTAKKDGSAKTLDGPKDISGLNVEGYNRLDNRTIQCCLFYDAPQLPAGIKVSNSDGNPATLFTDYEWNYLGDEGFNLRILTDGIEVSGEDTTNSIEIETVGGVSSLTINDLTLKNSRISCIITDDDSATITVKGNNSLTNTTGYVIKTNDVSGKDIVLNGDGNLIAAVTSGNLNPVLYATNSITLDMKGNLECIGYAHGITCKKLTVTNNIGKVIARGNIDDYGAIDLQPDGVVTIGDEIVATGSLAADASEANIAGEIETETKDSYIRFNLKGMQSAAMSILMTGPIKEAYITIADYDASNPTAENITCQGIEYSVEGYYYAFFKDNCFMYFYDNGVWYDSEGTLTESPDVSTCDTVIESFYLNCKRGVFSDDAKIYVNGNEDSNILPADSEDKIKAIENAITYNSQIEIDPSYSVHGANESTKIYCQYVLDPGYYVIIEGNEAVINVDEVDGFTFASDAPYRKFFNLDKGLVGRVLVDDETVDPYDYSHESGSTRVTFSSSYLSTLANGEHSLTIVSSDGEASTTFAITRNRKPSPGPGYVVPKTGVE